MKERKVALTRKIQLLIHTEDPAVKRQTRETFWKWQRMCHRAANYIYTHQFIQEQIKDLFYFTDEVRVRLANIQKIRTAFLPRHNSTPLINYSAGISKERCP
ncbi:hypothetical protein [Paraflavitalea speifideaquila]|uniref:hypothetical protein n=1 Tax=Paraflavitalea speifideaquila TaxID=3076558 RepID=UPI0028E8A573|nr:hypothetical protein [Paraflavitalea speifideiaquila]